MKLKTILILMLLFVIAAPLFAQGGAAAVSDEKGKWIVITAGFSMAIASGLCGLAQGKAVGSAAEAMARNPGAAGAIRFALILGLALIESLALYTLVIIFAKVN
jgi:F-type H+-transporting ATPase subunit c